MFICFCLLLWRSFKGFCWSDEAFYVSTTDRFYRGAVPLYDEWFRTQLSSLVMLPFYAAYVLIAGSNAGIILYFRILYLLLSATAAVISYRILSKNYPKYVAGCASLFVMIYAHLNNATFSYYMLSFVFLFTALMLIYDFNSLGKKGELVGAGVLIALSVLCMPAFSVGYAIIVLLVMGLIALCKIRFVSEHLSKEYDPAGARKALGYTLIGIVVPALIFAIYIAARAGIADLVKTLPYALVDNEHVNTFGYYIRKPHRSLKEVFGTYTYASYALIAASFVFARFLKKSMLGHVVVIVDTVLFLVMSFVSLGHTGYIQVAFFMFMIPVYFVSQKRNPKLFWLTVIPSVVVAVIYCFTSSDFLYVMAIGAALSTGTGVCVLYDFYTGNVKGNDKLSRVYACGLTIVCLFTLTVTLVLRIRNVYRDAPLANLTEPVTKGVAKGLYTTKDHLRMYFDVLDVIEEYCMDTGKFEVISGNPAGNVLFSKILPWGYAESGLSCGYPTTWRATAYDSTQLEKYYSIHTTNVPDVIIVLNDEYGSYDAAGDVDDDHNPNLDEMSDYWKDYIIQNGMSQIEVKCGKVYCRPR